MNSNISTISPCVVKGSPLSVQVIGGVAWTHPDVLEEPGAHDVGGVLGQDAALVLSGAVVVVEEVQVLVELELELQQQNHKQRPGGEQVHSGSTALFNTARGHRVGRGG